MVNYIIRRILWAIPVLLVISLITFSLGHAIPGGPFDREKTLPKEIIANLEAYYGLDDPLWKQYTDYLWNALHGDLGPSYSSRSRTVNDIISEHFPISTQLGILALILAMVVGIPLGMVSALKQNSYIDYFSMFFALLGVSVPAMTLGPVLVWFFALKLNLVTGSLIVEQIFAIPGTGKYFITSVTNRDYPVILGIMLLYAFLIIVANLVVDLTYAWIDPRIKYT